jgi:hypothetical protein
MPGMRSMSFVAGRGFFGERRAKSVEQVITCLRFTS